MPSRSADPREKALIIIISAPRIVRLTETWEASHENDYQYE